MEGEGFDEIEDPRQLVYGEASEGGSTKLIVGATGVTQRGGL